tara:strand:+ start:1384 stop:1824 length:441 start_codon:yes stop_codon:yes gene_type:complete
MSKYDRVKESIKIHEGFRMEPYLCTEKHLTGGWGHKIIDGEMIPYTEEGWQKLFDKDFETALNGARELVDEQKVHPIAFEVVIEMVFQLGKTGVSKFKKTLAAIDRHDYMDAGWEMKDSKWNMQTPNRCEELSLRMRNIPEQPMYI